MSLWNYKVLNREIKTLSYFLVLLLFFLGSVLRINCPAIIYGIISQIFYHFQVNFSVIFISLYSHTYIQTGHTHCFHTLLYLSLNIFMRQWKFHQANQMSLTYAMHFHCNILTLATIFLTTFSK